jgi:hypothetical protein
MEFLPFSSEMLPRFQEKIQGGTQEMKIQWHVTAHDTV